VDAVDVAVRGALEDEAGLGEGQHLAAGELEVERALDDEAILEGGDELVADPEDERVVRRAVDDEGRETADLRGPSAGRGKGSPRLAAASRAATGSCWAAAHPRSFAGVPGAVPGQRSRFIGMPSPSMSVSPRSRSRSSPRFSMRTRGTARGLSRPIDRWKWATSRAWSRVRAFSPSVDAAFSAGALQAATAEASRAAVMRVVFMGLSLSVFRVVLS
jgi:hypothetical protein